MQKVVGFFSKPENLFVLTLLIGLVSKGQLTYMFLS